MDADPPDTEPTSSTRTVRFLLGLLVAGVAGWVVVSSAGGFGDALGAIRRMRAGYVGVAFALTVLRLGLYAVQLAWLGRRTGPMTAPTAVGLALVVCGFGAVTPAAPAEGLALANGELRARGRTRREPLLTLGFSKWFAQRTFYVVAAVDVFVVVAAGHLTLVQGWPFPAVAALVIALLALTAVLVRGEQFSVVVAAAARHVRLHRLEPLVDARSAARQWHADAMAFIGPPSRRVRLALVSAAAVLCDAATLWATTHATGFHIHPELVVLAARSRRWRAGSPCCRVGSASSRSPSLRSCIASAFPSMPQWRRPSCTGASARCSPRSSAPQRSPRCARDARALQHPASGSVNRTFGASRLVGQRLARERCPEQRCDQADVEHACGEGQESDDGECWDTCGEAPQDEGETGNGAHGTAGGGGHEAGE